MKRINIGREERKQSLMRGRGVKNAIQTSGVACRGRNMGRKVRVMYRCKDRREGSADLPSSVGWCGGSLKGDRMQIQRNCTTESSQPMGNVEPQGHFEGKRTHKGEGRGYQRNVRRSILVLPISQGENEALQITRVPEVVYKGKAPQRIPVPCKKV